MGCREVAGPNQSQRDTPFLERCLSDTALRPLRQKHSPINTQEAHARLEGEISKFKRCLEREEKVELALGNVLTEPPVSERGSEHSKAQ